jgi:hypothetical protein
MTTVIAYLVPLLLVFPSWDSVLSESTAQRRRVKEGARKWVME